MALAKFFATILKFAALALLIFYRKILSPAKIVLFGQSARCRFSPTCSKFALSMFQRYSLPKAAYLSIRRILRCHPFWRRHARTPNMPNTN
ncbi:MAG: membrane protein insertion efficiency factor YidD [Puniceicoccales bacterium]|nr:membrane protein insertion efficiency factor YidD [Puniceicoccales bacterium]